jgi:hypothetical protein
VLIYVRESTVLIYGVTILTFGIPIYKHTWMLQDVNAQIGAVSISCTSVIGTLQITDYRLQITDWPHQSGAPERSTLGTLHQCQIGQVRMSDIHPGRFLTASSYHPHTSPPLPLHVMLPSQPCSCTNQYQHRPVGKPLQAPSTSSITLIYTTKHRYAQLSMVIQMHLIDL